MAQAVQGGPEQDPAFVAELVVRAVEANQFFILTDPVHEELIRRRAHDLNAFIAGRLAVAADDS